MAILIVYNENNSFLILVPPQLKAKTEMLLSAEAAKAAQKANLENSLETAQHALQDKQQVSTENIAMLFDCFYQMSPVP